MEAAVITLSANFTNGSWADSTSMPYVTSRISRLARLCMKRGETLT